MNRTAQIITNRLSLRKPQADSLEILANLCDKLELKKTVDSITELRKVQELRSTCLDFERDFPSVCFSLATGVGKTRLMGAFIAYLYITKGIKNFFVLAPNLTIYRKLMEDLDNPAHPKYVFQGIAEFVQNRPKVVTGENYQYIGSTLSGSDISINIFNISKINSETRAGKQPIIKRLSEYLGESYFQYLSNLQDLVLLMDESHHYRADRGMVVINELKPILGLELTATPQIERAGGPIKFKNVVFEYSLAKAIRDGFVKEPAVATRKDFDPSQYSADELDLIKLEDGVRIHEDTRVALDIYSRNNGVQLVKPFMLVVAQNTEHAGRLKDLISSTAFFDGRYAGKVMEIHSNQAGSEKEENVERLINLESHDNQIEIVIHVNMLKEGWDVKNLYTIVPLRTAASMTLREQTIGRGLRLPYGKRTGDSKVDKLTIVAHDKFQAIIEAANREDSIIRRENIIEITVADLPQAKEVVTVQSQVAQQIQELKAAIQNLPESEDKTKQLAHVQLREEVLAVISDMNKVSGVKSVQDLKNVEVKEIALKKVRSYYEYAKQGELYIEDIVKEAEKVYDVLVTAISQNIIEIPRITIHPKGDVRCGFKDFDLDVRSLNYQPVSEEILRQNLRDQERDAISGFGAGIVPDKLDNLIVNELINYPEVDYDRDVKLLFKLANQALDKFKSYLKQDDVDNVVQYTKRDLGRLIYSQLMEKFAYEVPDFEEVEVLPFEAIVPHNYEKYLADSIQHYSVTIEPTNDIPRKLFTGFKKSCHDKYKFASKTEKDFAAILEHDKAVLKWLRPAPKQFKIYWEHNSREYEPDFVVETANCIYLVETKKRMDLEGVDVQSKARAALYYCQNATKFTAQNGGKPWKYVLIPHDAVLLNASFDALMGRYEFRE